MSERADRFNRLYASDIDPWGFRSSEYECEKYEATLAALPRRHYELGIEAGCSIGELTRRLAARCDRLIGVDVSEVALAEARRRNIDLPHVSFVRGEIPGDWPDIDADLIILSEVLYFLTPIEIDQLAAKISKRWKASGNCVLVNYLEPIPEAVQGREAAERFIATVTDVSHAANIPGNGYRIDILTRAG